MSKAMPTEGEQGTRLGAEIPVWNWVHDVVTYPRAIVHAQSVEDVVRVVRDAARYPSPVRAHGSNHSVTSCTEANGGTVVAMSGLNRILEIGPDYVRAESGALLHDVARALRQRNRQFFVNTEIGNVSIGSLACASSKDSAMPGEYGQASSYCIGMKLVSPSGEIVEITEEEPELLQAARSSFGLFGIVVDATFRIGTLETLAVEHRVLKVREFVAALPELIAGGTSPMWFLFPFSARSEGRVMVELRRYTGAPADRLPREDLYWRLRNYLWATLAPAYNNAVTTAIPFKPVRHALAELGNRTIQVVWRSVRDRTTAPTSQIIRYPVGFGGFSTYTFCFAAFPEQEYGERLPEYFEWVRHYDRTRGYRPNMPAVCYRITHDQSSLLSYSWDGPVLTIDPASTGDPGWMDFVRAYNDFACERGGIPLLNQTPQLEPHYMRKAFGARLDRLEEIRRGIDPDGRFLSGYFRKFLQPVRDEA